MSLFLNNNKSKNTTQNLNFIDRRNLFKLNTIQKQKSNLLIEMILNDPQSIKNIENPTKEQIYKSISKDGLCIRYIKKEYLTEEMCITAIKQNGLSIQYIKEPLLNDKLIILSLKRNGLAIRYIDESKLNDDFKLLSINQNPFRLDFIKSPTEEMKFLSKRKKSHFLMKKNYIIDIDYKKLQPFRIIKNNPININTKSLNNNNNFLKLN